MFPKGGTERARIIERFSGETGKRLRVEAFTGQKLVGGDKDLAAELADMAELIQVKACDVIIQQDATDNDVYFIITGAFDIVVNPTPIRRRFPGGSPAIRSERWQPLSRSRNGL
ncbi:hypothetical protein OKW33_006027 [Paraburkholderia atlantica]|nr:hypothetical protein [Paraburkholderia atlantica]MBB5421274.1 hypothetical protein [Paraburkholderia atlantica]MPW10730.1 hypothetical protein [Paraburkholderia atlantica]NUY35398.1 hypothetical protein [Paraburkholderia atlantica]